MHEIWQKNSTIPTNLKFHCLGLKTEDMWPQDLYLQWFGKIYKSIFSNLGSLRICWTSKLPTFVPLSFVVRNSGPRPRCSEGTSLEKKSQELKGYSVLIIYFWTVEQQTVKIGLFSHSIKSNKALDLKSYDCTRMTPPPPFDISR